MVGERIRRMREYYGLSQVDLAKLCSMNVTQLRQYEYGYRNPKQKQIEKIAQALKVAPEVLNRSSDDLYRQLLFMIFCFYEDHGNIDIKKENEKWWMCVATDDEKELDAWNYCLSLVDDMKRQLSKEDFYNFLAQLGSNAFHERID